MIRKLLNEFEKKQATSFQEAIQNSIQSLRDEFQEERKERTEEKEILKIALLK